MTAPHPGLWLTPTLRLERPLTRGGMGAVWLAEHRGLQTTVVVKFLADELADHPEAAARFAREAAAASRVKSPHVVTMLDHGVTPEGLAYIAMERLEGYPLARHLAQAPALTAPQAALVVSQAAKALARAHAAGVVHRDIKPDNLFLCDDGTGAAFVKVLDFGIAKVAGDARLHETGAGAILGTYFYMSPEQIMGASGVDHRCDVWALAVVAYEMLAGQRPFVGDTAGAVSVRICAAPRVPPSSHRPGLSPAVDEVFARALSVSLDARYPTALALADALVAACGGVAAVPLVTARRVTTRAIRALGQAPTEGLGTPAPGATSGLSAAPRHAIAHAGSLPPEPDDLIGRTADLSRLGVRLAGGSRLVTLLAIGGLGKTRVALRASHAGRAQWPGGAWFCDLSSARSLEAVVVAVATALDLPLGADDPVAQLGTALAGRGPCLVVLDNAEQVAPQVASALARWLVAAPEVTFLATSRARLGLPEEQVLTLGPLLPEDAAALFLARATTARHGLALPPAEHAEVAALVALLGHAPLAIELVAARAGATPIASLHAQLAGLAEGAGPGGLPLRVVLDWAWAQLDAAPRAALAHLAVFDGGCAPEALPAVLGPALDAAQAAAAVQALVDAGLVRRLEDGRLATLGAIHALGAARLAAAGQREAAQARHGAWFAAYGAPQALDADELADGAARRARRGLELPNLLRASERAVARRDEAIAPGAALAAWGVLRHRGPPSLAIALLEATLPLCGEGPARARVREALGAARFAAGDPAGARAALEEAAREHEACGAPEGQARALTELGRAARRQGDLVEARAVLRRAGDLARAAGSPLREGAALFALARADADAGERVAAEASAAAARARLEAAGAEALLARACVVHAELVELGGEPARALPLHQEALGRARALGDRPLEARCLANLAEAGHAAGRLDDALRDGEAARALALALGDERAVARAAAALAPILRDLGLRDDAEDQAARAEAIFRRLGALPELGALLASRAVHRTDAEAARGDLAGAEAIAVAARGVRAEALRARVARARAALGLR